MRETKVQTKDRKISQLVVRQEEGCNRRDKISSTYIHMYHMYIERNNEDSKLLITGG